MISFDLGENNLETYLFDKKIFETKNLTRNTYYRIIINIQNNLINKINFSKQHSVEY